MVFIFLCLTYLVWQSVGPSMLLQMALFHSFLWLHNIPFLWLSNIYVHIFHIHPSVDGRLGCLKEAFFNDCITYIWPYKNLPSTKIHFIEEVRTLQCSQCDSESFTSITLRMLECPYLVLSLNTHTGGSNENSFVQKKCTYK